MAIPPNDSGIRANETNAGTASLSQMAGSWRKKLRWWKFLGDDREMAGLAGAGVDNLLLEDGSNLLLEDGSSVLLME